MMGLWEVGPMRKLRERVELRDEGEVNSVFTCVVLGWVYA